MIKKVVFVFLVFTLGLYASFQEGKKVFEKKCSSCHGGFISIKQLKENFFEKNNTLLNLTAPTVNMIAYDIMMGSKRIGGVEDKEMQQIEIEEYLKDYLEEPDLNNSIGDSHIIRFFENKKSMKDQLSLVEFKYLSVFFMEYQQNRLKNNPIQTKMLSNNYNEESLLSVAKEQNKLLLVYATSKTCYFCKKMDKEVLQHDYIKKEIDRNYRYIKVDVDNKSLPFGLNKQYKKITPTFFIVSNEGTFLKQYPGSWSEKDFLEILKENIK